MNLWADKKTLFPALTPIKVIDIELSSPLSPLDALRDYRGLRALVRLHGRPLGYIERPLVAGSCSASDLKRAILAEHNGAILRHLLLDRLAVPLGPDQLYPEDLVKGPHRADNREYLPLVTVAVCTRDRTPYLPLCLDSLNRLDYPNLDILIVDNAPTSDATERLVGTHYPNYRYFKELRPGLNWSRNRAIFEARGEIIAYTDDDCVVDPRWVKTLVNSFSENPEIKAVTGLVVPYELETEAQVLFERRGGFGKGFVRKWYQTYPGNGRPMADLYGGAGQFGTGANMAFRRFLFNHIGHFDPALDVGTLTRGGGDLEMFFRLLKKGEGLLYEPEAIVRHRHRRTHHELRKQMMDWGIGFASYVLRNALAYPEERSAFIRRGLWVLWELNIRRPIHSLADPLRLPWDLILAEGFGFLMGPTRYLLARSIASRNEHSFGPLSKPPISDPPEFAKHTKKCEKNIGAFHVDLGQPLPVLSGSADYFLVRILVYWKGRQLDTFEIPNCYQSIAAARLREAVVDHLGLRLMDPECKKSLDDLGTESYAALARHFMSIENGV